MFKKIWKYVKEHKKEVIVDVIALGTFGGAMAATLSCGYSAKESKEALTNDRVRD